MGVTAASDVQRDLRKLAQELKEDFENTATILNKHYSNVNVARVSGGVGGVIGTGLAVGGAIAAPFTFGVSLILSIVGASIGFAGGATSGGAVIARHFIEKRHLRQVQAKWEKFQDLCKKRPANMSMPPSETNRTQAERVATALRTATSLADAIVDTAVSPLRAAGAQAAVTAPRLALKIVTTPLFVLSVISMGLSVFDIVKGSWELHKQTGSPAGDTCQKLAESLEQFSQQLSSSTLLTDVE